MGDMSREPSMEEILSSIRRVIARDEAVRDDPVPVPSPFAKSFDEDEIANSEESDDVLELTEMSDSNMARRPASPLSDPKLSVQPSSSAELISPDSAAASRHSIDALAAVLAGDRPTAVPSLPSSGDVTLHTLVEAALRPMLKQWLDANLPPMVERIVATEIARITGGR